MFISFGGTSLKAGGKTWSSHEVGTRPRACIDFLITNSVEVGSNGWFSPSCLRETIKYRSFIYRGRMEERA